MPYSPAHLKSGDTIGIISSARKISMEEISAAKALIEKEGFNVMVGKSIGLASNQYAGSDKDRIEDFTSMMENRNVKAIWFARGGYGSVRLMQYIDKDLFTSNLKWIVGYSDITVWHGYFNSILDCETIHGTMPVNFSSNSSESITSVFSALKGEWSGFQFDSHRFVEGEVEAELIGGNLSILHSINSTTADFNYRNKILFIEDLDEYLYHIDRMMNTLKYSGKLDQIKGLIVGGMTDMNDNTIPFGKSAEEIIYEHTSFLNIPVCFGAPFGHQDHNLAIVVGKKVCLRVEKTGSCTISPCQ